ncbi:MAG: transketolase [Candidatus Methanoperedens sp.]|nr:transketolase [Candidatus Methanoperedens sp.]
MIPVCKEIREDILKISKKSGHGHIPTCFSVVEILYAIYNTIKHDPRNPSWNERDIFILSKGHASLAHYCVLAHFGYFDIEKVYSFGAFLSDFGCHADRLKIPGIEASTGSLGHGIGLAVGMALGLKIKKNNRRVFTLIGDGESNEGSVWESVMVAVNLKLDNLTIIYDNNMSHSRGLQIHNPAEHFKGFCCDVVEINGHDVNVIEKELVKKSDTVRVIVANTKKGYDCKTLIESQYAWHRKSPNDQEFEKLMEELCEETI